MQHHGRRKLAQKNPIAMRGLAVCVLASGSLCIAGDVPQISLTLIAGPDTPVHAFGNRPALHNGVVAFYGYRGEIYGDDVVVAISPADGGGLYTILAKEGDPRPDVPGSVFDAFGNPAVHEGSVVFYGTEFTTLPSTYHATSTQGYTLYDDAGIPNPFLSELGVTTPASQSGIAYIDSTHTTHFLGLRDTPLPCGSGSFGFNNINGLQYAPHGGTTLIWPAEANTSEYDGNAVVAYDVVSELMSCVATGLDTIPGFGGPFGFFPDADTDGVNAAFIGYEPTISFDRFQGVYVRDISGAGPIIRVADTEMQAPNGVGAFGSFEHVTIDGDLVIFEGCAGGPGGCAVYGFFGCFLSDGVPGAVFEILTTGSTVDARPIIDLTMSPTGRDQNQFAFDVRHASNSASLYVATITRGGDTCPADLAAPFGSLDFSDVAAFLVAFDAMDPSADLAAPIGQFDFSDVAAFLAAFGAGCP